MTDEVATFTRNGDAACFAIGPPGASEALKAARPVAIAG